MKKILKSIFAVSILLLMLTSCMKKDETVVKEGDNVLVHYEWRFENWEKFDSSYDRWSPFEFVVWAGWVIEGMDDEVRWMKIWEKKTITVLPEKWYWFRDESKIDQVPRENLKHLEDEWYVLEKWGLLWTAVWNFEIVDVTDEYVTIDLNHQMAWKTLIFDIEVVEIKE